MIKFFTKSILLSCVLFLAQSAYPNTTIAVECEDFQFLGDWIVFGSQEASNGKHLILQARNPKPALTAVKIPKDGKYTLWVRALDFTDKTQGMRKFNVSVDGKYSSNYFGVSGKRGFTWEKGDTYDLKAGTVLLGIHDDGTFHNGRIDMIVLTTKSPFKPISTNAHHRWPLAEIVRLDVDKDSEEVKMSSCESIDSSKVFAEIENDFMKVRFVSAKRNGVDSAAIKIKAKTNEGFVDLPVNSSKESYQVISANKDISLVMKQARFFPLWDNSPIKEVKINCGNASYTTNSNSKFCIWSAGKSEEAIIKSVKKISEKKLELEFYPLESGILKASWDLGENSCYANVKLSFTPNKEMQYSLGYYLFDEKNIDEVEELLMPMLIQQKRFPKASYSLPQTHAPTPLSIMQIGKSDKAFTIGIVGDPKVTPFEFPTPCKPRYVLHIKNFRELLQPSIYGPVVGTEYSKFSSGSEVKFSFNVLVKNSDVQTSFATVTKEIFEVKDYRKNSSTSLTETCLNMMDLFLDDEFGGWWEKAKGSYQIEGKGCVTNSTPLTPLSLFMLSGDMNMYEKRALPTLEFILSRSGEHFSPAPSRAGTYPKGSMNGPVRMFSSAVYSDIWQLTNKFTPAFRNIAYSKEKFPENLNEEITVGKSRHPSFEIYLARYLHFKNPADLEEAKRLADKFIDERITAPATEDMGLSPFFLLTNVTAWEGLLRLYETTQEKRFLDAAVKAARVLMTGIWSWPQIPQGKVTIYDGKGTPIDKRHRKLYKGFDEFRLNFPDGLEAALKPKQVEASLVSDVGLGFEQPSTYTFQEQGGRMIFQAPWASGFLRLAEYTGDKTFEMYARNATLGRYTNYPGYYYAGFSDLAQNPKYPFQGPDISFIYYHHIPVHLSWVIDYLVSDAKLISKSKVKFPSLRQHGYAFFDYLIYGHDSGEIYGQKGAWLWLKRNLVNIDNPQINYITAHTKDKFFVVLTNQSTQKEDFKITFNPSQISKGSKTFESVLDIAQDTPKTFKLSNNVLSLSIAPRGQICLMVEGLNIEVVTHKNYTPKAADSSAGVQVIDCGKSLSMNLAPIQVLPEFWNAYVWLNAGEEAFKELELKWSSKTQKGSLKCASYPYEFSVPLSAKENEFKCQISGTKADGSNFISPEATIVNMNCQAN